MLIQQTGLLVDLFLMAFMLSDQMIHFDGVQKFLIQWCNYLRQKNWLSIKKLFSMVIWQRFLCKYGKADLFWFNSFLLSLPGLGPNFVITSSTAIRKLFELHPVPFIHSIWDIDLMSSEIWNSRHGQLLHRFFLAKIIHNTQEKRLCELNFIQIR